jgi:hypothetical protein
MAASVTTAPDLSLHIGPPSPSDARSSVEGDDTCHETGLNDEPNLCLGLDTATTDMAHQDSVHSGQQQRLRIHQPVQIQRFKKSSSGGKRSSRAPRMRWTTALHAHFVHAVELLGGHESMFDLIVLVINPAIVFNCISSLIMHYLVCASSSSSITWPNYPLASSYL